MFNPVDAFAKQFKPYADGFIFYPSAKSGGKFLSADEVEKLTSDWERVAGRSGRWKIVGIIIAVIALWSIAEPFFMWPEWINSIVTYGMATCVSGWIFWQSLAARRLVAGRDDVAPPRLMKDARRDVRKGMNWPFVVFGVCATGLIFFGALTAENRTTLNLLWLVGSGVFFVLYLWIVIQKLRDMRHN